MRKNRPAPENRSRSESSRMYGNNMNTTALVILLIAILFFLFGLFALARAYGFNPFGMMGSNTRGPQGTMQNRGGSGGGSNSGGTRPAGGSNGGGGETNGTTGQDLNVNVKTDLGPEVDAGIKDGQLKVDPNLQLKEDGEVGGEASVNKDKVIDTDSLLR